MTPEAQEAKKKRDMIEELQYLQPEHEDMPREVYELINIDRKTMESMHSKNTTILLVRSKDISES
jgi:hypothetical protein